MKCLCIGGGGFQGSHLVESLARDGHEIIILNTPSDHAQNNFNNYLQDIDNVMMVWGSVVDKDMVDLLVPMVDIIFHLGAKINVDDSIRNPYQFYEVNVKGTQNVLDACLEHDKRLFFWSSTEVYGGPSNGLNPASPYAASKCAADRMCYAYWRTHQLPVTILRPSNIYGPRQKTGGGGALIPIFFDMATAGEPLTIFGDGKQFREYLHVFDLIRAVKLVMKEDTFIGKEINIGSGSHHSINEIAELIIDIVGGGSMVHEKGRKGEVLSFKLDTSLLDERGFSPQIHIRDGLESYYRWKLGGKSSGRKRRKKKDTVRSG